MTATEYVAKVGIVTEPIFGDEQGEVIFADGSKIPAVVYIPGKEIAWGERVIVLVATPTTVHVACTPSQTVPSQLGVRGMTLTKLPYNGTGIVRLESGELFVARSQRMLFSAQTPIVVVGEDPNKVMIVAYDHRT